MNTRRTFIKTGALATTGISLLGAGSLKAAVSASFSSNRPSPADRNFISEAVEATIAKAKSKIQDEKLELFSGTSENLC